MRHALSLLLLISACLTHTAHADNKPDDATCKLICTSARQDCRAQAQGATENDTSPILSMKPSSNRYEIAGQQVRSESQQLRPTEAEAFRARRAERLQACEVPYRSCARSCATPATAHGA